MSQSIRIAISGGGLAGASLMPALLPYPHIDVHMFECAPAFKEAGLAIGVTRNAQAALNLIGPPGPEILKHAGAAPLKGGEVINEVDNSSGNRLTSIIHRAAYLQQLLTGVPEDHPHASKNLEGMNRNADGSVIMKFTDGTVHGEDDPVAQPRNMAQASMGKELVNAEYARECSWVGQRSYIFRNVLSNAVASLNEWRRTVIEDETRKLYADWPSPRTYVSGPLCVMGDAAHAATPSHGSSAALKAYDHVPRPRTRRIVESSRQMGMMLVGKGGQICFKMKKAGNLLPRWDFILDIDMLEHRNEAIQKMLDELALSV
ncbi:hypothetical protein F4782DRAFT_543939 [Xylaria castorea]|nr:hypothetical protein F4782DRAFT_543939 [Xylaria castorea]